MYKRQKPILYRPIRAISGIALLTLANGQSSLIAQNESADSDDAEVYLLSPFEVGGSEQSGYRATNTLAGTRIKSDLKDVGASIFVATKELMEDTGSSNVEDLLVYVAGSEVAGLGGNYAASDFVSGGNTTVGTTQNPQTPTRIRGLAGADLTRDLYLTSIPFDSYNTTSVTVNRGPNAVLFGLGSPAGIVDNSLMKPTFTDHNNVEFRYGSYGSTRASFDVDRALLEGKLGVRLAGVYDNREFEQQPAFERTNRLYAALDFKVLESDSSSTSLKGNFEWGDSDSNRPRTEPPGDEITGWWLTGNQTADWLMDWRDQDRTVFSIPGSTWYQIATVYNQPDATTTGGAGVPNAFNTLTNVFITDPVDPQLAAALAAGGRSDYLASFRGIASFQDYAAGRAGTPGAYTPEQGGDFFIDRHLSDRSIFDYRKQLLDGPTKSEYYEFNAYNVALEQLFFNGDLGIEVALDQQNFDNGFFGIYTQGGGIDQGSIAIDVNSHYPNGDPNPNYGRPFVSAGGRATERENERETFRVTAFGKFDFRDKLDNRLGSILGRHSVTGLYSKQTVDQFSAGFNGFAPDQNFLQNFKNTSNVLDGNYSDTRVMYYLGESLAGAQSAAGANISNVQSSLLVPASIPDVLAYDPVQQAFVRTPVNFTSYHTDRLALANGASKTRTEVDSTAVIWQGHFFSDSLVGMVGWRKDEATSYTAGTPPRADDNHVLIYDPSFVLDTDNPLSSAEAKTWTYSAVYHVPDRISNFLGEGTDLSFHYSQSENFEPANPRFNAMGRPLSSPEGETEDYGLTLGLFNNKLTMRASWFETAQTTITNSLVPTGQMGLIRRYYEGTLRGLNDDIPDQRDFLLANLPSQELQDFYGWEIETFGDNDPMNDIVRQSTGGRSVAGVTNRITEGVEIEMVYNPIENWTIMFNASQAEARQSGIDEGVTEMMEYFQPLVDNAPDLRDSELNFFFGDLAKDSVLNPWNVVILSDGTPVTELREWRWNIITNYRFREDSKLKGINFGGAARWLDKPALGLPVAYSDVLEDYALDPTNPYYGSAEFNVDAWVGYTTKIMNDRVDWKLQLNVRNVVGGGDLVTVAVQPDGSFVNGRIAQGTEWELSSRFSF